MSIGAIRIEAVERFPDPAFARLQAIVFAEHDLPSPDLAALLDEEGAQAIKPAPFAPSRQRFGAYDGDELVGWSYGWIERPGEFYVSSSGVVPSHRRRGIYTALLETVREYALQQGLVMIRSQHSAVNNAVIMAKLRAGYHICGLSQSARMGTLVEMVLHLTASREDLFRKRSMSYVRPAATDVDAGAGAREVRYQAVVVEGDRLLLLEMRTPDGRAFALLPGGGRETGESAEACVIREVREEACADVEVDRLLYEMPASPPHRTYQRWETYLCRLVGGSRPRPGKEEWGEITGLRWLDLQRPDTWSIALVGDAYLYPQLVRIRAELGYGSDPVVVRAARTGDVEAMLSCDTCASESALRREAIEAAVAQRQALVALQGATVAGFAIITRHFFDRSFLSLLVVGDAYRRRGIATHLLRSAEENCPQARLFASTNASNLAARGLLAKCGYVRSGVVENLDDGDPEFIYVKELA